MPSLRERLRAVAYARRVPLRAEIELTRRCNLRCRHCYLPPEADGRPEIDVADVERLLRELRREGCMTVVLTGGEVLLRGDGFFRVAATVKAEGMGLSVITNGTMWTAAAAARLAALRPSSVTVSLYAADAERHDGVTGVPGSFQRTLAGVRHLTSAGVKVALTSVLMPDLLDGFRELRDLAAGLGCWLTFDPTVAPRSDGSMDVVAYRVPADRLLGFYLDEFTLAHSREGQAARGERRQPAGKRNCPAGFTSVFVDAFGDVYSCMGLPPVFGNVREASFASVWRGQVAERHRAAMERPLDMCLGCDIAAYCTTRCPRLALLEDGSLSGPSSRACEMTRMVLRLRDELQRREGLAGGGGREGVPHSVTAGRDGVSSPAQGSGERVAPCGLTGNR